MLERDRLDEAFAMLGALLDERGETTRTHDPSPAFLGELQRILSLLGVEVRDGDL